MALQGAHTREVLSGKTVAKERTHILPILEELYPTGGTSHGSRGKGRMLDRMACSKGARVGDLMERPLICCNLFMLQEFL